ncbi:MAG: SGNH/GDSL hydrolase family protein [Clostridiales bacterium]|nr:SGNH/GDSL hydrolase family protein [Clostridiales bacterium]
MKKFIVLLLTLMMIALCAAPTLAEDPADPPLLLEGKNVSFLGDSITTFAGYSNNPDYNAKMKDNYVYYFGTNYITDVNDTWWMQVVNKTGAELLVNNSWSGDQVVQKGVLRAKLLHNNEGTPPDIIVIYLGINDCTWGIDLKRFQYGYQRMIKNAQAAYPDADIFLCTLLYTPAMNAGQSPDTVTDYNAVIVKSAEELGCTVIDLYNDSGITPKNYSQYMGDRVLHPNKKGMTLIGDCVIHTLSEYYQK